MRTTKYQRGEGIWPVIFLLAIIAFVVFTVLKIFTVYSEDFAIESALKSVEEEVGAEYRTKGSLQNAIAKRILVNNVKQISVKDDIIIERDGAFYYVDIDYEVVVPYIGNISLLLTFEHSATIKASD